MNIKIGLSFLFLVIIASCSTNSLTNDNKLGLDKDSIAGTVNKNISDVTNCYEKGLNENKSLSGRFVVGWIIDKNGKVKDPKIAETTLNNPTTENCVIEKLSLWQFPKPTGEVDVTVYYPFKLQIK